MNKIEKTKELIHNIKEETNKNAENIYNDITVLAKQEKDERNWRVFEESVINELYSALEIVYSLTLKGIKDIYFINLEIIPNRELIEDLTYQEDGLTIEDRVSNYCNEYKEEEKIPEHTLLYDMIRILDTETIYLFNHLLKNKIPKDRYPYAEIVNGDECCERCSEWCNGEIWNVDEIVEPPYHPGCECEIVFLSQEEVGENQ